MNFWTESIKNSESIKNLLGHTILAQCLSHLQKLLYAEVSPCNGVIYPCGCSDEILKLPRIYACCCICCCCRRRRCCCCCGCCWIYWWHAKITKSFMSFQPNFTMDMVVKANIGYCFLAMWQIIKIDHFEILTQDHMGLEISGRYSVSCGFHPITARR